MKKNIKKVLITVICIAMTISGTTLSLAHDTNALADAFNLQEDSSNSGGSGSGGGIGAGGWVRPPSGGGGVNGFIRELTDAWGERRTIDFESLNYYATEGDWFTPIYFADYHAYHDCYSKVTLTPIMGGDELEKDFYWTSGRGGVLFLENTPSGSYSIFIDDEEQFGHLVVIGKNEKYVINASSLLPSDFNDVQPNDIVGSIFLDMSDFPALIPAYDKNYSNTYGNYGMYADGKLYFSVYGVNLSASDITAATVQYGSGGAAYATLEKIIAGRSAGNSVRELILIMKPVNNALPPPAEIDLNVRFRSEVNGLSGSQFTKSFMFDEFNTSFYADTTHLDQHKLDLLVPEPIYSGAELSCAVGYPNIFVPDDWDIHLSDNHSNGRYTFTFPENYILLSSDVWWNFMVHLNITSPFSSFKTIPIKEIVSNTINDEYSTNINGESFFVFPESLRGISREDVVFSLANGDLTPVDGVTIEKVTHTWYNEYIFKSNAPLPSGNYSLMMGKFFFKPIHLSDSVAPPSNGRLGSSNFLYESDLLSLYLPKSNFYGDVIPNEWELILTNLKTGTIITLTPTDGSLKALEGEVNHFLSAHGLPPGIYAKEYSDGHGIGSYPPLWGSIYDLLIVKPDEPSLFVYDGWTDTDADNGASAFFLSGSAPAGSDLSGLKVETFKTTVPFIDPQSVSVTTLSTNGLNSDGYFTGYAYARDLKINEPGLYWFVVTDQSGNVIYTTQDSFTKTSLKTPAPPAPLTASISGTVTLKNQPVAVNVELWNGNNKLKNVTSAADGSFSFTDLPTGVKYTVKIPAGSTWQTFSQDCDLTASDITLQITLTAPAAPTTSTASISGTVSLKNQPVAVNVELWNGNTKLKNVTSAAVGSFSFTDLSTGIKYTVKIPAGSTWQAFSQDCDLATSNINLQVTLTAPAAGGGGLGVGGGGGGGGGSSGAVVPVTTKPAITTGTAVNISAPAVSAGTDIGAASKADGITALASFSDASRIAPWATAFFERLIKEGVISGRDNGTLDPKGYVTRAEFTKMIVLAMNIKAGSETLSFEDVKESAWYKEYVDLASSNGIVQGVSESSFAPNANISRQDLCTIVFRALTHVNAKLPDAEALSFPDADAIGNYAGDAVATLKQLGIISGRDDGRFDPAAFATREETAKIICGVMDYIST